MSQNCQRNKVLSNFISSFLLAIELKIKGYSCRNVLSADELMVASSKFLFL